MDISFIIPAYNEEKNIGLTIQSIRLSMERACVRFGRELAYEVIVVDNGSVDRTASICRENGVEPVESYAKTIGALRNYGAHVAKGAVFVFLDADIVLLQGWSDNFPAVFKTLMESELIISGSKVLSADPETFLSRVWFHESAREQKYMNSAHLIIHRKFFQGLSGFDESLISGEDSDLSRRALILGGTIQSVSGLQVVHHGAPGNLWDFFRRERWHGRGDFQSWEIFRSSRPSHLAVANLGAIVAAVMVGIFVTFWSLTVYPLILVALSSAAAFHRTGCRLNERFAPLILIYSVYIMGRTLSLLDSLCGVRPQRWR